MSTVVTGKNHDTARLPERVTRFPFPFSGDSYRYSTNVEPARTPVATEAGAWGTRVIDVDERYLADLKERAGVLNRDPHGYRRCPTCGLPCGTPSKPCFP